MNAYKRFAKKLDLHSIEFYNGADAFEFLEWFFRSKRGGCSCKPLIISDNQMPIMDGTTLSLKLHSLKQELGNFD